MFFQYYYKKLHEEHKTWNPRQITTIIKLLWKKKKLQKKTGKDTGDIRPILRKSTSGWIQFKRAKAKEGIDKADLRGIWKQLPRESKIHWEKVGRGWRILSKRRKEYLKKTKSLLQLGSQIPTGDESESTTNLGFMRKMIR